jgi:predicted Fe-S protein YdhL (DUF1289 family)
MPISTPCIRVCILDPDTGLCEGCGRTRDEIAAWYGLSEEERHRIMDGLEERMAQAFAFAVAAAPEGTA